MEIWSIDEAFDTLLLKNWPPENIETVIAALRRNINPFEIVEALNPNLERADLFRNDALERTIREFCGRKSRCDKYKFCQNVALHSRGLECVTAAGIKMRLAASFPHVWQFNDAVFQRQVMSNCRCSRKRRNLGVLVFDYLDEPDECRQHAMKVLFDRFYLYTTPAIDRHTNYDEQALSRISRFIVKQIARNADCVVLFASDASYDAWNAENRAFSTVLSRSLALDFKVPLVIVSLSAGADQFASALLGVFQKLKPVVLGSSEFLQAPSGGLAAFVERACQLAAGDACLKYWFRGLEVFQLLGGSRARPAVRDQQIPLVDHAG